MKFIQVSDIHIGECRSLPNYLERHAGILDQITKLAVAQALPLIIPGDLFHTKRTTFEEQQVAFQWLANLDRLNIPTILTAGNHDHLYGTTTQIDLLNYCNYKNIQVVGWEPRVITWGDTSFLCLSWHGYTSQELNDEVRRFLPEMVASKYRVVLVHECLLSAIFDNGFPSKAGCLLPHIPEITYWAIGDIHKQQKTNLENGHYAGAPAMFKFDDVLEKGCLIVDLANPTAPEFKPIQSKRLLTVQTVEEMKEDAYYLVKGDLETVLKANKEVGVVRTEWDRAQQQPIHYDKLSISDGLAEFLSEKGLDANWQTKAFTWLNKEFTSQGEMNEDTAQVYESEAV